MNADRRPLPRGLLIVATILVAVVMLAIVAANAPANWLALYIARETQGVVLLADAQGTIWSGSAVVALGGPEGRPDERRNATSTERLALPGRVIWTLEMAGALAPVLHLTHDGVLLQPLLVRYVDGLALDPGAAVLPSSMSRLFGAPMNTLLPEGRCTLRWGALRFDRDGPPIGEGTLDFEGFALALSPVRPLGDYQVKWASTARGLTWQIATRRGPLMVEGSGDIVASRTQARVLVRVAADAPSNVAAQLGLLLDMIGRRGGNEAVIEVGARS